MEDGAQTSEMFTSMFAQPEPQAGGSAGFTPWHEMPENRVRDEVAEVIAGTSRGPEEKKQDGTALHGDIAREILSYVYTPNNLQFHVGNLANAPAKHFIVRNPVNQLLVHMTRGQWAKPSKRKCKECKRGYFGFVCKSVAGDKVICPRCLGVETPEPVKLPESTRSGSSFRRRGNSDGQKIVLEAANRRKHRAKVLMIESAFIKNYSPGGIEGVVNPFSAVDKDLLVMNATKLGKTQRVVTH